MFTSENAFFRRHTITAYLSFIILLFTAAVMVKKARFINSNEEMGYESGFEMALPQPTRRFTQRLNSTVNTPLFKERTISESLTKEVHAASIAESTQGDIIAFWYGGSREGGKDVAIYSATLPIDQSSWGASRIVVTREQTQKELHRYIKKLGNPVAVMDESQRLWLFYVSVSMGGWAGSAINVKISDDGGLHWGPAQRLITSPFVNVSTLVKGHPVVYKNGHFGIPIYHEFMGKFAEMMEVDRSGAVINKQRLTSGRFSLQPVVLIEDQFRAQAYLRFAGEKPRHILLTKSDDAGESWSEPEKTTLPNPNAAIAAHLIQGGRLDQYHLLVFNNAYNHRNRLSLAVSSQQGRDWQILFDLEHSDDLSDRYSYPHLIESSNGHYHLVYSWNREYIKHIEFNDAWLESLMEDVSVKSGEVSRVL